MQKTDKETTIRKNVYYVTLFDFLNKKKKYLNSLIDDFENLAYRLKKEQLAGIGQKEIEIYSKRLNEVNQNIIDQRKVITKLEEELLKKELFKR